MNAAERTTALFPVAHPVDASPLATREKLLLGCLFFAYCTLGFTGLDLSRQDEAYIFGIVLEYTRGTDWIIPMLAGEPFMEKPPLYYLVAAAFARTFHPLLPLHEAARLASGFFVALTAMALALAEHVAYARRSSFLAVLCLFAMPGLLVESHRLLTDNANLAGMTIALLGLVGAARQRRWSGLAIGTGIGIAFLAKGLFGVGIIGVGAALLLLSPRWRTRAYRTTLLHALLFALPWLLIWPSLLYVKSPALFDEWFLQNNLGRFLGFAPAKLNAIYDWSVWYETLPWATFPVFFFAALSVYRRRGPVLPDQATQAVLAYIAALLFVLMASSSMMSPYALPIFPALALLAVPAVRDPPPALARFLHVSGSVLFLVAGCASWAIWWLLMYEGNNGFLRSLASKLSPGHPMPLHPLGAAIAAGVTLFWFFCRRAWRPHRWGGVAVWQSSLLAAALLAWLLWLPWVTETRSGYRPLFQQIGALVPREGCVSSLGLGEAQRGMLDYVLGLRTVRETGDGPIHCPTLLIDTTEAARLPELSSEWRLRFQGRRSGNDHEMFLLYLRSATPPLTDGIISPRNRVW